MSKLPVVIVSFGCLLLSGCTSAAGDRIVGLNPLPTPSPFFALPPDLEMMVQEEGIDKTELGWQGRLCLDEISTVASLPTPYERQRGPMITLEAPYTFTRSNQKTDTATCTLDYLLGSADRAAFAAVDIEYQSSSVVWAEFHEAVGDRLTVQLAADGWSMYHLDKQAVGVLPDLNFYRDLPTDHIKEYLDVFFYRDEEVIFELMVVDEE